MRYRAALAAAALHRATDSMRPRRKDRRPVRRRLDALPRAFAESLESRRLLAALVVTGGGGDDHIVTRVDDNFISPFVNSTLTPQPRSLYDSTPANGFGGDDNILIKNTRSEP